MHRKKCQKWFLYMLVLFIGYTPLAACSKEMSRDHNGKFSYTLSFDAKGMPMVLDASGQPVPAKRVEGPVDAKKIVRVRNFSVIDVEGSHFILFQINGTMYRFDLPHTN
jgi:hypothetical protein